HIERVPDSADEWLWTVRSPFYDLGGWKDYAAEERRIIADSVRLYPWEHLRAAVRSTLLQFANFTTDITTAPHEMVYTLQAFENYAPQILDRVRAARQQTGEVEVRPLNYLHVPVAVFSLLGLAVIAFAPRRARLQPQAVALAVTILLALLLNAAICGVFSNPVNRYQSRLIWLAPLAVMIAVATRTRENAA
ncbi:MAG: hypothetical protein JOZ70_02960, partial [Pseudolabrys sp.]|nr:hypothetical protein [Pseudolabrys sp.]